VEGHPAERPAAPRHRRPSRNPPGGESQRKAATKSLKWAGGLVGVLLVAILTAFGNNIGKLLFDSTAGSLHGHTNAPNEALSCTPRQPFTAGKPRLPHPTRHPPFTVNVSRENPLSPTGFGYVVFPQKITLLRPSFPRWVVDSSKGYDGNSTWLDLVLTAHQRLTIINMYAYVASRRPPLTGTEFAKPPQGGSPSTRFFFNLDTSDPTALTKNPFSGRRYFTSNTFTMRRDEQNTFSISAFTCSSAVRWVIGITYLEHNHRRTMYVYDTHNLPFQTTAAALANDRYDWVYGPCWALIKACTGSRYNTVVRIR
jgi:hypothetical protein